MARGISILTIVCLCLMFGIEDISYADSKINPALMQEHIEKVKLTNPRKYQAMIQRAGGNITHCSSCHKQVMQQRRK